MGIPVVPSDGNAVLTLLGYISTFIVTLVGAAVTVTFKLAAERRAVEEKMEARFEAARAERRREIEAAERNAGEGIKAVREKANEIELWTRDNLVRREDFKIAVEGLSRTVERIDNKLDRIAQNIREDRIDRDASS
jgi:ABC-type protease/lipase transport system fused ATPase/permease subunit